MLKLFSFLKDVWFMNPFKKFHKSVQSKHVASFNFEQQKKSYVIVSQTLEYHDQCINYVGIRASWLPKLLADSQISQLGNPPDCQVLHHLYIDVWHKCPHILADYQI